MKIFVTGTRGVPDIPGGVETHCQNLYPLIAAQGHEVFIAVRSSYRVTEAQEWKGIRLVNCFSPRRKSLEAIVHTFLALLKARRLNPDVVHIHAVGPALLVPFARLLGLKVVFTNHGPDYDRQKWGRAAQSMLRLGEWLGGRFANEVIVISSVIGKIIEQRCGRTSHLIYNGVLSPTPETETDYLAGLGVTPKKYILAVARFVPEKGLADLIEAFAGLDTDYKLVIAGDADHETEYSRGLKKMAGENKGVVLTGYLTGAKLAQVFSHAGLFVLPSYHEGLPIALLEAMSYGLPVLVSDIPANKEVDLAPDRFFRTGNIQDLRDKLHSHLQKEMSQGEKDALRAMIALKYDWERIAVQTVQVYRAAAG
ncbi:MAG: glycosyltransferase family 4 protein [Proteobacteria bacterium]|nr:glycosyltransferase family 4 protein [Pseudomonadota bacterium]MBU1545465.1 glycosyltransferase family 4 protein [Pseudomonadota bacterium]